MATLNLNRHSEIVVLQNAAVGAANGTVLDTTNALAVKFEVSGTFTALTVNWEASMDGTNFFAVSATSLATGTSATTATATGFYKVDYIIGLVAFRARITAAGPTGSITVKGVRIEV